MASANWEPANAARPNGPRCGCGKNGCWELFSSSRAALRYYRELRPKGPLVAFQELLNLAEEGDSAAAQAFASVSPSTILIAGNLTSAWHRFGPVIEKEVTDLTLAGSSPLIRPSHEGEIARLRGAAALVFQRGARRTTSARTTASATMTS
jgi:predicted NBD/HSP70 family sugar kinase